MTLMPTMTELLARARADLRMGVPVVLSDGGDGVAILAAETATPGRLGDMQALGAVLAITARRAETLKARAYDGDLARILVPKEADARWLKGMADPAGDLATPMKGPLMSAREGSAHLHRLALMMVKDAHLLPAVLVAPLAGSSQTPQSFAAMHGLTVLEATLAGPVLAASTRPLPVVAARLPVAEAGAGRLHVFRAEDGGEEHYAFEVGAASRDAPVLARLHSACFTGDVLGSLKCDCGPQLHAALRQMGTEGAGVLLYLNQEGRGIGLANKMRAYSLQDQGFDTVEANHRLGFEDDERDFALGAHILAKMGFSAVRLMTNNPKKIAMMEKAGIAVTERVPLIVGEGDLNRAYLATKAAKSGHLL